jgi:hypothetical protein
LRATTELKRFATFDAASRIFVEVIQQPTAERHSASAGIRSAIRSTKHAGPASPKRCGTKHAQQLATAD